MKRNSIKTAIVLLSAASAGVLGCELVVDFDRTRIPVEVSEAGTTDGSVPGIVTTDAAGNPDAQDAESDAADASADAPDDVADARDD